jgi:hypothetical protein
MNGASTPAGLCRAGVKLKFGLTVLFRQSCVVALIVVSLDNETKARVVSVDVPQLQLREEKMIQMPRFKPLSRSQLCASRSISFSRAARDSPDQVIAERVARELA